MGDLKMSYDKSHHEGECDKCSIEYTEQDTMRDLCTKLNN